ncbi:hypothetical protein AKJ52_00425 [candidate division MSBL1 archaeon SCGC-AAA382C18]|uniref:Uncharacterized protein n=1 Tax=candidate division MSBL1 archaeon SCGC-AAA382C18 TaxID=1698281 RepID=A0A133VLU0_9EURY|nr:hypothetical protein AKJ52_00425 [candidate division MSBL1 archaeon SCGC-AAA382C18]
MNELSGNMSMNEVLDRLERNYTAVMRRRDSMGSAFAGNIYVGLKDDIKIDYNIYIPKWRKGTKKR